MIKLGFRNLVKYRRRSLKTMMTVVIGLGASLMAQGFISHTLWGLKESLIRGGLGHFQVYRRGYLENSETEPYRYLIRGGDAVAREFSSVPGVMLATPRLNFQGIVSSGEKSSIVMGMAGIPANEEMLNGFSTLQHGSFLRSDQPYRMAVGGGLARKLGVSVGDPLTLMLTLKSGGVNAADLEVGGVIGAQVKAFDEVLAMADLGTVQKLVNQPGSVDRIIVLLSNTADVAKTEPAVRSLCGKLGLEYRDWKRLAGPQYSVPNIFFNSMLVLMMGIIVFVVVVSIANTLTLAMQERIREIGTIRSVGTTRPQVAGIFLTESFLLGVFGGLLGLALGFGLSELLNAAGGIPIPPPPGQARGFTALFKPDPGQAVLFFGMFSLTAAVAGLWPAVRAARLQIVDALRWL